MRRGLKLLGAAGALGGLQWLGDLVVEATGWPVPGALVGMLLLLVALAIRGSVPQSVDVVSSRLLGHLMLFLIPSVAAVAMQADALARHGLVFLLVGASTTLLTALVTAWVLHRTLPSPR